jgi:Asp/Glu/hydantoin racemase
MKIVIIPAYQGAGHNPAEGHYVTNELLANMRKKGQLDGVDVDLDDGYPFPPEVAGRFNPPPRERNEEFLAYINLGIVKRVRAYLEMGKHDAIVQEGDLDPGFFGARFVSKVPFTSVTHAAIHVASLIGERCSIIAMDDWPAKIIRRIVQNYGFDQKVASVRRWPLSSAQLIVRKYKKEERIKVPEIKRAIEDLARQCIAAIEKEKVDSLIFGCAGVQVFADEAREELDKAGYSEIPIITGLSAAVEMAKAMVNMKLTQAPRAYLSPKIKAEPEFR